MCFVVMDGPHKVSELGLLRGIMMTSIIHIITFGQK